MSPKTILFASLVLPMLMTACSREEQSPSAAAPSQDVQAQVPISPEKAMEDAPPAADMPPRVAEEPDAGSTAPMSPAEATKSDSQQPQEESAKGD